MIDVCLLGTGGMMPLPYRWLTSLSVHYKGKGILIDCGEGTQITMKKRGISPNPIGVMLFTHYHADHISGLPGMLLAMGNAERQEPLLMVGPRGLERVVSSLRVIAPELPFEIKYKELTQPVETFDLPGESEFHITAWKVSHSVPCYCYSMELERAGMFDAARAKAQNIPLLYWSRLQKGEIIADPAAPGGVYTPEMVLGPQRKGIKLAYATDSRPCPNIVSAAAGADLFICEGMYSEEDKLPKAREKKHMTFCEAARIGAAAKPARMWLTHFSPSEMHPENNIQEAQKIYPPVVCGKDGRKITLNFEENE